MKSARFTLAAAALVVAVASAGFAPQAGARVQEKLTSSHGVPFAVVNPDVPGISNFAEIEPGLSRGGHPSDEGIDYLRSHHYRTVVAFWTGKGEREKLAAAGIALVELPMRAGLFSADPPTKTQLDEFLKVASDPARRPLFFHCRRGRDRTGAMAAIYRMERQAWRRSDAVEEMKAFGFSTHYKKLLNFVAAYPDAGANAPGGAPGD
jgi:hypothetical protein